VVELHPEQYDQRGLAEVAVIHKYYIPGWRFAIENVQK
jgi:hypothetical protein